MQTEDVDPVLGSCWAATLAQHYPSTGPTSCACWDIILQYRGGGNQVSGELLSGCVVKYLI